MLVLTLIAGDIKLLSNKYVSVDDSVQHLIMLAKSFSFVVTVTI